MNTKIYILTHVEDNGTPDGGSFEIVDTSREEEGGLSERLYGELTGLYRIWKHDMISEFIGVCQYRRFFSDEDGNIIEGAKCDQLVKENEVILSRPVKLQTTYREHFAEEGNGGLLRPLGEVIRDRTPEYSSVFQEFIEGDTYHRKNLFITSRKIFMKYCEWMFDILQDMEWKIDTRYYKKRVFSELSQVLLEVFVKKNGYVIKEYDVVETQEKKEITEMRENIQALMRQHKAVEAAKYFRSWLSENPDFVKRIENKQSRAGFFAQIIQICEEEEQCGYKGLLDVTQDIEEMLEKYAELRSVIVSPRGREVNELLAHPEVSWIAIREGLGSINMKDSYKNNVVQRIAKFFMENGKEEQGKELEKVWF